MKYMLRWICITVIAAAATCAGAQNYPTKPIRMISAQRARAARTTRWAVSSPRIWATRSGEQIVIDNRAGAGGLLGMEIGKGSAPDGYTLVAASTAAMLDRAAYLQEIALRPLKDFEFISLYAATPNVLVVNPNVPAKNMKEWVDWVKANGNRSTWRRRARARRAT